eukprot:scpid83191/ scgid7865/ 
MMARLTLLWCALAATLVTVSVESSLLSLINCDSSSLPSESKGYCRYYSWGGSSYVHHFICCNNRNEDSYGPCPGSSRVTYDSASDPEHCDRDGNIISPNGCKKGIDDFTCGGCSGQEEVRRYCNDIKIVGSEVPSTCWLWAACFVNQCTGSSYTNTVISKRSTSNRTFIPAMCGNLVCDTSKGETAASCPVDCCSLKNPKRCSLSRSLTCSDDCCAEPACCLTENETNNQDEGSGAESLTRRVPCIHMLLLLLAFTSMAFYFMQC